MNAKIGLALGAVAGVAIVTGLLWLALAPVEDAPFEKGSGREERAEKAERPEKARKLVKEVKPAVSTQTVAKVERERRPLKMEKTKNWYEDLPSAKDRAIAKRIQDALDADDREAVFKAAEDALSSKSAEVRQAAVEALSLQGEEALKPLLNYVGDPDKDVAESAYRAWDDAADGLDSDFRKMDAIKEVLTVAKDEEHVKAAVGKIESFDQARAIRELAKLAKEGGKASNAAKESYEQVTGEPFESWAAAELKAMAIDRDNKAAEGEAK